MLNHELKRLRDHSENFKEASFIQRIVLAHEYWKGFLDQILTVNPQENFQIQRLHLQTVRPAFQILYCGWRKALCLVKLHGSQAYIQRRLLWAIVHHLRFWSRLVDQGQKLDSHTLRNIKRANWQCPQKDKSETQRINQTSFGVKGYFL